MGAIKEKLPSESGNETIGIGLSSLIFFNKIEFVLSCKIIVCACMMTFLYYVYISHKPHSDSHFY